MSKLLNDHNDLCVGIDLGTTNSVLATINEKPNGDIVSKVVEISRATDMYNTVSSKPRLTTMKRPTLPSCVYYRQENNFESLVGDFAKMQYPLRPHLVAKSIKSKMNKKTVEELSEDIPDKTPAEISSRILKHLLKEASKIYRCDITDAIITVPANFTPVMCKATIDAAKLAGIKVQNDDGTDRPILLSEPNAVIYDLINQIHNGEISDRILDLNKEKNVLVFDIGGGTLDITIHKISRNKELGEMSLNVDEIATNRYTLLGGDDFDEMIAEAMYSRYLNQYENYPEVVSKLTKEKETIMSQLRVYAEYLKLDLNERCFQDLDSGWDLDAEDISISTGGNMGGIGYAYDDSFTKEEIEKILSPLMADDFAYDDYKNFNLIKNTHNIIYPILDVLYKATKKLGVNDIKIDAVILNGGMSKFYMISERLSRFFGFDPIIALDPDQSVARGAAVFHHLLHKNEASKKEMKSIDLDDKDSFEKITSKINIQWNHILNESLYLGVKNGAVHEIIPTGSSLPYNSAIMTGFKIEPGQNKILIPIKMKKETNDYATIATGEIIFKKHYKEGAYVSFTISMNQDKIISLNAWTSTDSNGENKIEQGFTKISVENFEKAGIKSKLLAPVGSKLQPKYEINNLLNLCQNLSNLHNGAEKSTMAKRVWECVNNIIHASNKEDFAPVILKTMRSTTNEEARMRLFLITRKIGQCWNIEKRKELAEICMDQIKPELLGIAAKGLKQSTNIQAIYTLSICGSKEDLQLLKPLQSNSKYLMSMLYTYSKTQTELKWLKNTFINDIKKSMENKANYLQFSSYAIGVALKKDMDHPLNMLWEKEIVDYLCKIIESGKLNAEDLISCIIALGLILDQRFDSVINIPSKTIESVLNTLENIDKIYDLSFLNRASKSLKISKKMINGYNLNDDEEKFLLTKLNC